MNNCRKYNCKCDDCLDAQDRLEEKKQNKNKRARRQEYTLSDAEFHAMFTGDWS
jgi:hypothetical protein